MKLNYEKTNIQKKIRKMAMTLSTHTPAIHLMTQSFRH